MATLTSQIQALINYANETTEKVDTRLGDAVKSLADGYKGGGVDYPLPTITDADALSSKLTSLIAYANGITGKGDATIGDAVRSLVEGYDSGGLPQGYTECEYLESTGSQYIQTDIIPFYPYKLRTKIIARQNDVDADVLYSRKDSGNTRWGFGVSSPHYLQRVIIMNNGYLLTADSTAQRDTILEIELNFSSTPSIKVNGKSLTFNTSQSILTDLYNPPVTNIPCIMFGNRVGYGSISYSKIRIYYASLLDEDDNVKHELIPCLNEEGKTGIYDTTLKKFYPKQGIGEFLYKLK